MKNFIIQVFKYGLFVLILSNAISFLANYFLRNSFFYKSTSIVNQFKKGEEFDYVVAGSSRGLTTIDTELLDENLATKGYNLSMDDTGLPSHLLMIQHFFESGFSAKRCILVLDEFHFERSPDGISGNDYRMAPFASRQYVKEYFFNREEGVIKPLALAGYFPALAFSYYNSELITASIIAGFRPTYRHRFDEFGNYSYPNFSLPESEKANKTTSVTKSVNNPLLVFLQDYLKKRNCELLIYIAPYQYKDLDIKNPLHFSIIDDSRLLTDKTLFFDPIHVTERGKKQATLSLADRLKAL